MAVLSNLAKLLNIKKELVKMKNKLVTTQLLGKATISDQAYVNPDNSPIKIDKDFLGNPRKKRNPSVGPFENSESGIQRINVWKHIDK